MIEDVASAGGNNEDSRITPDIERRYDRIRAANNDKRDQQDVGAAVGGRAETDGGGGIRFCNWCHIVVDNVDKVSFPGKGFFGGKFEFPHNLPTEEAPATSSTGCGSKP